MPINYKKYIKRRTKESNEAGNFYKDFLNDDTCTKQIFGDEINPQKSNLYRCSSGKLTEKIILTTQIPNNIYYRGYSFWNVVFDGINLNHVCFHNCKFYFCEFKNITTHNPNKYSKPKSNINVFNVCDFIKCEFTNCDFNNTVWSIGTLNSVTFNDTKFLDYSLFYRNSFINVKFRGDCILCDTCIIRPSGQFDVKFYNENGFIKITPNSYVSNFDYKDKINISDYKIYSIWKKEYYREVASTYYALEKLGDSNCLIPQYVNYYYQRKKAETRSKTKLKSIPYYLNELVIGYGEYPFKSFMSMIVVILFFSFIYLFTGFVNINGYNILYKFNIESILSISISKLDIGNWLQSLYFSFFTLITVGQGSAYPITPLSQIFVSIELFIGTILMTLFTATLFRKYTK